CNGRRAMVRRCWAAAALSLVAVAGSALAAAGGPDSTFGSRGLVRTQIGAGSSVSDVAVQRDRKIVVAGSTGGDYSTLETVLARYRPNGSLDRSFGHGGIVTTALSPGADYANALALARDGKIVVAGTAAVGGSPAFAVTRYLSNGALD